MLHCMHPRGHVRMYTRDTMVRALGLRPRTCKVPIRDRGAAFRGTVRDQRITAHAAASALPHSTQRWLQVTQLDGNGGDSTGGRGFVLAPFTQITSQVDRTALRGIGTMPYYFVLWHTLWCSRIPWYAVASVTRWVSVE